MSRVFLVNPATATIGYSFLTPRWLFVIAAATPAELVGDPVLIDESLERFNPEAIRPGDIVGIGISSGNCVAGYRVLRQAKQRGATVVMGGIHATIFPDEPLEMGADAVVTGNGDLIWRCVIEDILSHRLRQRYVGGRVPGESLLKARWDLVDPAKYMFPAVQTVAGCPENCSFCSVWVTDGRQPRQRLTEKIIEEANELYNLGFRFVVFSDDNFNPATLGRIAREPSLIKRRELQRIREERLQFFDEYHRSVPKNFYAFTQMTAEAVSDPEYLTAMHDKVRVRTVLLGVESFTEEGLISANKQWNPVGQAMIETIQQIQNAGIIVLASIISGLEPDTRRSVAAMSEFARRSGAVLAQFTVYQPLPGTKDYYEMMNDRRRKDLIHFAPKHKTQIVHDRFWLRPEPPVYHILHAHMSSDELLTENQKCWRNFYSVREILHRIRSGMPRQWPFTGKVCYVLLCMAFRRVYAKHGVSADSVQKKKSLWTRTLIKVGVGVYSLCFRQKRIKFRIGSVTAQGRAARA